MISLDFSVLYLILKQLKLMFISIGCSEKDMDMDPNGCNACYNHCLNEHLSVLEVEKNETGRYCSPNK